MTIQRITKESHAIESLLKKTSDTLMTFWSDNREKLLIDRKEDNTFVSEADYAANKILIDGLTALFPDIPIVSEEAIIDVENTDYWLIDPLDGTAGFINGDDDFAILMAYVGSDGAILAGWVVFPATNQFFSAIDGKLAYVGVTNDLSLSTNNQLEDGSVYLRRGVSDPEESFPPEVNVEGFHSGVGWMKFFQGELSGLILELGRLGTWDIAAPLAIAEALGAAAINERGEAFRIQSVMMPGQRLIVGGAAVTEELRALDQSLFSVKES